MHEAWILDAVRTPRGRGKKDKGGLSGIHPQELLAQTFQAVAERTGIDRAAVDDAVIGCVSQVSEQGANIARNSLLAADWPLETTGVTLNRFCGSGLQAVSFATMGVMSGQQQLVLAGGVESMSRVAMMSDGAGIDGNNLHLRQRLHQVPQGIGADLIATLEGFSRENLDAYALRSQQRAAAAQEAGHFARGMIPARDPASGEVALDRDEHPRADTTLEGLASLDPVFTRFGASPSGKGELTVDQVALERYPQVSEIQHLHTAGNSSGIVDGAAAVLVASDDYARAHGLQPRARIRAVATLGSEPVIMLTAPAPTSEKALAKAGMKASDIDLWEINEAFAAVALQTIRKLGIDEERVNVNGGAIALGHPLGATGAMLLGTLVDELERRDLQAGLVTLCIGGGMGIAVVVERI